MMSLASTGGSPLRTNCPGSNPGQSRTSARAVCRGRPARPAAGHGSPTCQSGSTFEPRSRFVAVEHERRLDQRVVVQPVVDDEQHHRVGGRYLVGRVLAQFDALRHVAASTWGRRRPPWERLAFSSRATDRASASSAAGVALVGEQEHDPVLEGKPPPVEGGHQSTDDVVGRVVVDVVGPAR